ncbi:MAG: 1-deoxy-D-xylulose 5-phosphate reductoisomerase [Evtepia sp.]|jgi:1-deoxy-D-xylulose-5-phosphate reductoisomerase|nr:1-deoxy-D-xylulose 5-phosphate reductoisomerase [Evtepia sp.]
MERTISVLGSTGSIGVQTLEVAEACQIQVVAVAARSNVELLEKQARKWNPKLVAVADLTAAADLKLRLRDTNIRVAAGPEGVLEAAVLPEADTVVTAMVGIAGLAPTLAAVDAGKRVALANKETLVCAGPLVMKHAVERGACIVPVDSEHSAIFQCLQGNQNKGEVKRLILTASGGPFFGYSRGMLEQVTVEQALKHPNWTMGKKVTIDSATLMNKGLELLEAMALFQMPPEKISILVHRESIVHSLVEYCDNAVLAQLGTPDMHLPIQYALSWPERVVGVATALDLLSCPPLTFTSPDLDRFSCLALAIDAAKTGGTAPAILNGANEIAVARFLSGEIRFLDIPRLVERTLERIVSKETLTLDAVFEADAEARLFASGEPARVLR